MMMRLCGNIQLTEDNVNKVLELYRALGDSDAGSDRDMLGLTPSTSSNDVSIHSSAGDSGVVDPIHEQTEQSVIEPAELDCIPRYVAVGDGMVGELLPVLDENGTRRLRLVRILSGPELEGINPGEVESVSSGRSDHESDYVADSGQSLESGSIESSIQGS